MHNYSLVETQFADTATKYLLENATILVVVLIFGLMLEEAVKFSVPQDHTVHIPHVNFLAGVGSDYPRTHSTCLISNTGLYLKHVMQLFFFLVNLIVSCSMT
jgi:hypothetical protein